MAKSTTRATAAILTAAGSGTRLGRDLPKALVEVDGIPLVVHAARRLVASGVVDQVVVTAPPGLDTTVRALLDAAGLTARVVTGGATRQESVAAGLEAIADDADVVLVHDAARPFASPELIRRVAAAVRSGHRAAVPGLPVVDTVRAVSAPTAQSLDSPLVEPATHTPDRSRLRAVQTPQGFDRDLLDRAHAAAAAAPAGRADATDDAALVEALGEQVVLVAGEEAAFKITTERDLYLAGLYAGAAR